MALLFSSLWFFHSIIYPCIYILFNWMAFNWIYISNLLLFYSYSWRSDDKWLGKILPAWLWETESKAWIQFEINWKPVISQSASVKRQAVCFIKDPRYVIELDAMKVHTAGHERFNFNLTKTEKLNSKLVVRLFFYIYF